jgi:glutamate carboxypeptidase
MAAARRMSPRLCALLEELVLIESHSADKPGNDRVTRVVARELTSLGAEVTRSPQARFGDHLRACWAGTGAHGLIVGHVDTVWPAGTLARMGYREAGGRIYGPGVLDMKGGIAAVVTALELLKSEGRWPARPLTVIVNTDEERGSPTSRPLIEQNARGAAYAVIAEPGHGPAGALMTSRKGVGEFRVAVTGRASHAGVAPEKGVSAVHELALQVPALYALARPADGTTINVGVISGGSARNTVAAQAEALIDVRVPDDARAREVEAAIRSIAPRLAGTQIAIEGGFHRPPVQRTPAMAEIIARVQRMASELGMALTEEPTAGATDGNLTAAMGVPTLDGMGPVGENPHAEGENIIAGELVKRTALLAKALAEL